MRLEKKYRLLEKEAKLLKQSYPSLKLFTGNDGDAFVTGSLEIEQGISYSVELYLGLAEKDFKACRV